MVTMTAMSFVHLPIVRAKDLQSSTPRLVLDYTWDFTNLAGRLIEISEASAAGALSFMATIVAERQRYGEPTIWVAASASIFYPPDFALCGIDLAGLPVAWVTDKRGCLYVLDMLLRSGTFGLVIADLGADYQFDDASLGRLLKLAERHQTAVFFLTHKPNDEPSLGSMISLRAAVSRSETAPFTSEIQVLRDKRGGRHVVERRVADGPIGMS
jgi:hypothetical protein